MDFITLTKENLSAEHICCAISGNNDCQVASKKEWLARRLDDGLVFLKGDVRGKCFIEYIPAEKAWAPIEAADCMYIDCLWVSGQYKGQGNASLLLGSCIEDSRAKGKRGLVTLSSDKKRPFLGDPKFLKYKGFQSVDSAAPFFELMFLPFDSELAPPRFNECVKSPQVSGEGFVIYYTSQCPFTAKYVPLIEAAAREKSAPLKAIHLQSAGEAQNAPSPYTAFSLFYNGRFVTNEIPSQAKFAKLLDEKGF